MVKNLILIRHGKAEPGSLDQLDEERRLLPRASTRFARPPALPAALRLWMIASASMRRCG